MDVDDDISVMILPIFETVPNAYNIGILTSVHPVAEKRKEVCNSNPVEGTTTKLPAVGGWLVVTVILLMIPAQDKLNV